MSWDFSTEPEFQKKLDWVEEFCREEVEPLEYVFPYAVRSRDPKIRALVKGLQDQVKDQGLWAIFLDEELGGPGYGQLKLGLLERDPRPLPVGAADVRRGRARHRQHGDARGVRHRRAEEALARADAQPGDLVGVLDDRAAGWFGPEPVPHARRAATATSGSSTARSGSRARGASPTSSSSCARTACSSCPRETPGVEIQPEPRNHNHIIYSDVRVPADHLLGPEDGAKVLAQRRLGGGRIHHAMRTIAQCKLAFDMMCERALSRESHGKIIAEHQMVQEKIADSYASIRMLRLFVLETAWKIDNTSTQETRTDIAAVKYTMAKVLREVSFNALHILGSLGTTNLTPLQAMYAAAPTMGIADGVDEVHKATVARNVLKGYRPHEGYWPTEYIPAKREQAWEKFEPQVPGRSRAARARRGLREVHRAAAA